MIKKIINEWDPIEFFPMAPEDEYSNEILKIEKYLADNGNTDVQTLAVAIDNIFASSFGRDVYLADMNDCVEVAKKISTTSLFSEIEKDHMGRHRMSHSIIFEDDTDLAEYEAISKGYRKDVTVLIDDRRFKLYITDIVRLHQDVDLEIEENGYYQNEPNTIIVKEVSKAEIEKTIDAHYKGGFFDELGWCK